MHRPFLPFPALPLSSLFSISHPHIFSIFLCVFRPLPLFSIFDRLFSSVFSSLQVLCFWLFSGIFKCFRLFSVVFGCFHLFSIVVECFRVRNRTYFRWEIIPVSSEKSNLNARHFPVIPLSSPYPPLLSIFHLCISSVYGCFRVRNCTPSPYPTCTSVPFSISPILHILSLVYEL